MNKEIQARWISALESGLFAQGQGFLRQNDNYCCLGVLCNIYTEDHPDIQWTKFASMMNVSMLSKSNRAITKISYVSSDPYELPKEVQEWAELSQSNPSVRYSDSDIYWTLAELNDTMGLTFKDIAKLIPQL